MIREINDKNQSLVKLLISTKQKMFAIISSNNIKFFWDLSVY